MPAFRMPMRWADIDSLNHVNNVVYVDYAREARYALVQAGVVPDRVTTRLEVEFFAPMHLSRRDVLVSSLLDGDRLLQEVRTDSEVSPLFAKLVSTLGTFTALESGGVKTSPYALRLRRSDLDPAGNAVLAQIVEYLQEARVYAFADLFKTGKLGNIVVAAMDVEFACEIPWRAEPYDAFTGVSKVGNSSFTTVTEIRDGRVLLARATTVLVTFDAASQKSRPLAEAERVALERFATV